MAGEEKYFGKLIMYLNRTTKQTLRTEDLVCVRVRRARRGVP